MGGGAARGPDDGDDDAAVGGRLIGGRYRLLARIGAGAMGTVWRAYDERLRVDVAVKEVRLDDRLPAAERADRLAAAMREARNAARLRAHPHVVAVHDAVEDAGLPWIVMELVAATSLEDAVVDRGPLPADEVAHIGLAVLDALAAAGRIGMLHRDVKPVNILLAEDGRTLLTDFGVATHVADTTLVGVGVSAGTPAYMAPERLTERAATGAADLFSLGVTLYFAASGVSPFVRDTVSETYGALLYAHPPPLPQTGRLWPVLNGLLVKDPAGRLTADGARALLARAAVDPGLRPGGGRPDPGANSAPEQRTPADAADGTPVTSLADPPDALDVPAPHDVPAARRAGGGSKERGRRGTGARRGSERMPPRTLLAAGAALGLVLVVLAAGLVWRLAVGGSSDSGQDAGPRSGWRPGTVRSSEPTGADALPDGMGGAWTGTIRQGPVDFTAEVVLRGGPVGAIVGTSDNPTDGCTADLKLLEVEGDRVVMQERVITSSGLCRGADRLTLTLRPDGRLDYRFEATQINSVGTGILDRA